MQVKHIRQAQSLNLKYISEPGGYKQTQVGPVALDEGVDRNGAAMDKVDDFGLVTLGRALNITGESNEQTLKRVQ